MLAIIFSFTIIFSAVAGFIGYMHDQRKETAETETMNEEAMHEEIIHTEQKAA